jgi:N-methylhydantoinase A
MGLDVEAAAEGIVDIANAHMARALRVISVQRGIDPRGFTLVSFGGAGGLHVCALAEELGLDEALVPVHGGVLSALGMLAARPGRQLSRTRLGPLAGFRSVALQDELDELAADGLAALSREGVVPEDCEVSASLDLRYAGQSYVLNVPWGDLAMAEKRFHRLHAERYGHALELSVELVNLRVSVLGPAVEPMLARPGVGPDARAEAYFELPGVPGGAALYRRAVLRGGQVLQGPAIVAEQVATTWLAPGWQALVDAVGNLRLSRLGMS